jgi:membrane protein implicated in regulation of membrane protease activity
VGWNLKATKEESSSAPLFSSARFDQDSIVIYPLFSATAIVMYLFGFGYFAAIPATLLVMIFVVEASERVRAERLQERQLVGAKCRVVRQISRSKRGVVEIVDTWGMPQWELWSAESDLPLEEGAFARVKGKRGMFLEIEPLS